MSLSAGWTPQVGFRWAGAGCGRVWQCICTALSGRRGGDGVVVGEVYRCAYRSRQLAFRQCVPWLASTCAACTVNGSWSIQLWYRFRSNAIPSSAHAATTADIARTHAAGTR